VVVGHPKPVHPPPRPKPAVTNGRKPPKQAESEFDDDEGEEEDYEEEEEYEEEEDDEEEEDEEEDGEGDEEDEVKATQRGRRTGVPPSRGRRPVNGSKANGRDGLFNLGTSLTVTGKPFVRFF
jgi:hypothetical protein